MTIPTEPRAWADDPQAIQIAETRTRIRRQIALIRACRRDAGDSALALRVLHTMQHSLRALRWTRAAADRARQPWEPPGAALRQD